MQLPAVLISLAKNQVEIGRKLHEKGCAVYLGRWQEIDADNVAAVLDSVIGEPDIRERLGRAGSLMVDGLGVYRVLKAVSAHSPGGVPEL